MNVVCLDLEGVLVPEIWIAFAEEAGIPELKRTTRDEPDYDKLMKWRLDVLAEHGLGLPDVQRPSRRSTPCPAPARFWTSCAASPRSSSSPTPSSSSPSPSWRSSAGRRVLQRARRRRRRHHHRLRHALPRDQAHPRCARCTPAACRPRRRDSHNDLGMILDSKAGFLFRTTDAIKAEYPELPALETYDELLAAIKAAL